MNIYIANSRIFEIEGEINDLLNKKEEELCNVLPKSSNFEKEKIFSSRVDNNKNLYFIIENEKIDKQIDYLYKEKNILLNFIEKELIRLDKYKEVESIIIYYRENKLKKYTWEFISKKVHLTERQCRNIYKKFKRIRNF